MLCCAIVIISLFYSVNALSCPFGYSSGAGDLCYMVYANRSCHLDASVQCSNDGGRLASIYNAFTNAFIQDLAEKAGTLIWLGLRCPDAIAKNCRWDDDQGAPNQYDAFYPGYPSGTGECVFMMIDGPPSGKWVTQDCDMLNGFVCEVEAKTSCGDYDHYGDYCYKGYNQTLSQNDAESQCQNECGHLVSIHSANENQMILDTYTGNVNYVRVGLQANGEAFVWSDNTTFDYNNIGYSSSTTGNCIALSPVSELVPRGKWISVSCTSPLPFICKIEADCSKPTTPTPVTLAPSTCDAPYYFTEQNRTITSPNYPRNYAALTQCRYQLTTDSKHRIRLTFGAIETEQCCDIIDVYDYDGTPYYVLLGRFSGQIAAGNKTFTSTFNEMIVDFNSDSIGEKGGFSAVAIAVV